jgi:PQQ-dependent dehydrogenase (methanol/ethanol family)
MRVAFFATSVLVLALIGVTASQAPKPVDNARLAAAGSDSGNWLMYGRTYDDHRFSPLKQINEQTIGQLGLMWSREFPTTRGLQATPLVENGVIYTTSSWSVVYALDAKTGNVRWMYDPAVPRTRAFFICCDVVNRGVALYRGKVYVGTLDGRLIALDAQSGKPVWSVATTDPAQPYAVTGYPRIAKDMVIIGNAGAEYGVRGYISAYNAETGKMVWRTYTVPGDARRGRASSTIPRSISCTSAPAIRRRGIETSEERPKRTTCMRRRFSPCGPPTASSPGTSRPCPVTTGTTTPRSR